MAKKVLSIEIGNTSTKICLVDYGVKNPRVYNHINLETPEGTLSDGMLSYGESFVVRVLNAIRENKMTSKDVVFSVNSSRIPTREITVPTTKEKKFKDIIEANKAEYFPIDVSDYELSYIKLESAVVNKNESRLLLVAVPKSLIDSYKSFAEACGLNMVALDYGGNSIYQMVKDICEDGNQIIVKVDEQNSVMTVLKDRTIVMQRSISYGIGDAINAIRQNRVFGCRSYIEAMELAVRQTCLSLDTNDDQDNNTAIEDIDVSNAKKEVSNSLKPLCDGIYRAVDFYLMQARKKREEESNGADNEPEQINGFYVTGIGSDFSGFSKLLSNELGIKVRNIRHMNGMNVDKSFQYGNFGEYFCCIGAVLNPVGYVADKKKEKAESGSGYEAGGVLFPISLIVLLGAIIGCCGFVGMKWMEQTNLQNQNNKLRFDVSQHEEIKTIKKNYEREMDLSDKVNRLYSYTENSNNKLLKFIEDLEKNLPTNCQVLSFSSTSEGVTMNMEVDNKEELATVLEELRKFSSIYPDSVIISGASDDISSEERTVSFAVSCNYKIEDYDSSRTLDDDLDESTDETGEEVAESAN